MLVRPEHPVWLQITLIAFPIVVAVSLAWGLLRLQGDLTYEVRRDRAALRARAKLVRDLAVSDVADADPWSVLTQDTGPLRLQQQRVKGWRTPEDAVRVSRGTDWGNPWKVGDLVPLPGFDGSISVTPALAVELFAAWVTERGWIEQMTAELEGQDLVCWCKIGAPCHADWILETVNKPSILMHFTTHANESIPTFVHKHLTRGSTRL